MTGALPDPALVSPQISNRQRFFLCEEEAARMDASVVPMEINDLEGEMGGLEEPGQETALAPMGGQAPAQ